MRLASAAMGEVDGVERRSRLAVFLSGSRRFFLWATRPLQRMWRSDDPLEDYALVHLASVGGDTLLAVALADSIFFSLPVDEARTQVALYLILTMAPLAVAAPVLIPLLDRSPYRRAISFGASAGRAVAVLFAARWVSSPLLFPAAFLVLVLSKIHTTTKNAFTIAYAPTHQGLVASNAFLGRVAVAGLLLAAAPGALVLKAGSSSAVLVFAALVYATAALLNLRLPPANVPAPEAPVSVDRRGRVVELARAAAATAGLRAAQGFLLALVAFALRAEDRPSYWFAVLLVAGTGGAAVGDVVAPRLPRAAREEIVVIGSLVAAGVAGLFALQTFSLPSLAVFALTVGMATEFGRLGFQSMMQRSAPGGAQGRVFVRYEVAFQLAWIGGAFVPAMFGVPLRGGTLILALFYLALGIPYLVQALREPGTSA